MDALGRGSERAPRVEVEAKHSGHEAGRSCWRCARRASVLSRPREMDERHVAVLFLGVGRASKQAGLMRDVDDNSVC